MNIAILVPHVTPIHKIEAPEKLEYTFDIEWCKRHFAGVIITTISDEELTTLESATYGEDLTKLIQDLITRNRGYIDTLVPETSPERELLAA